MAIVEPTPFTLRVPDADLADLRDRLARARFPDQAPGDAWAYGTDVGYLRDLAEYWRSHFDWRAAEAALNAFPQFRVPLDGIDVHYLQVPGVVDPGPDRVHVGELGGDGAHARADDRTTTLRRLCVT